ncbi:MAG: RluA family pseudouridine synthase [Nitrososphaerota archaeon]
MDLKRELLRLLDEDEDLIVLDKPAGMMTHTVAEKISGTLVNALLYHCRDLSGIGGELKPGVVHRLDKLTSGVMVAAKSERAHLKLAEQFKRHSIERAYLALVWGNPKGDSGRIESRIARNPRQRLKMTGRRGMGKIAITEWRVKRRFKHFSLIECRLFTGRTHQIRVHLSEMGFPLVGDALYGKGRQASEKIAPEIRDALKDLNRQALHAYKLGFEHPVSGKWLSFNSPLPSELNMLIQLLEQFDQ